MAIVLFAVCAIFGVATVALWAAWSSARLKLSRAEVMLKTLSDIVQQQQVLTAAERKELMSQVDVLFETR